MEQLDKDISDVLSECMSKGSFISGEDYNKINLLLNDKEVVEIINKLHADSPHEFPLSIKDSFLKGSKQITLNINSIGSVVYTQQVLYSQVMNSEVNAIPITKETKLNAANIATNERAEVALLFDEVLSKTLSSKEFFKLKGRGPEHQKDDLMKNIQKIREQMGLSKTSADSRPQL